MPSHPERTSTLSVQIYEAPSPSIIAAAHVTNSTYETLDRLGPHPLASGTEPDFQHVPLELRRTGTALTFLALLNYDYTPLAAERAIQAQWSSEYPYTIGGQDERPIKPRLPHPMKDQIEVELGSHVDKALQLGATLLAISDGLASLQERLGRNGCPLMRIEAQSPGEAPNRYIQTASVSPDDIGANQHYPPMTSIQTYQLEQYDVVTQLAPSGEHNTPAIVLAADRKYTPNVMLTTSFSLRLATSSTHQGKAWSLSVDSNSTFRDTAGPHTSNRNILGVQQHLDEIALLLAPELYNRQPTAS